MEDCMRNGGEMGSSAGWRDRGRLLQRMMRVEDGDGDGERGERRERREGKCS